MLLPATNGHFHPGRQSISKGEVSYVCCGCKATKAALSVVDLWSEQMGRVAAKLLLRQIKSLGKVKPECIKLTERLIIRESTAPALGKADKRLNCKNPERLSLRVEKLI